MTPGQWLVNFFWTNTDLLEAVNKWGGVAIAATGAMIVAPQATKHLLTSGFGKPIARAALRVKKILAHLQGRTPDQVTITRSVAFDSEFGTPMLIQSEPFEEEATLEEKFRWLKTHLESLNAIWQARADRLDEVDQLTRQQMDDLSTRLQDRLEGLGSEIRRIERDSVQIDATGLLPILAGIILTGVPEELASWEVWGWLVFGFFASVTVYAAIKSYRIGMWN